MRTYVNTIYIYVSNDLQSSSQGQGCQYVISVKNMFAMVDHQQLVNYNATRDPVLLAYILSNPTATEGLQLRTCSTGPIIIV